MRTRGGHCEEAHAGNGLLPHTVTWSQKDKSSCLIGEKVAPMMLLRVTHKHMTHEHTYSNTTHTIKDTYKDIHKPIHKEKENE